MAEFSDLLLAAGKSQREFGRALQRYRESRREIPQAALNTLLLTWIKTHPPDQTLPRLPGLVNELCRRKSVHSAWNALSFLEVALKLRRPRVGIYDHAFHYIGGAQKYGLTMAETLQNDFEVTLLANKPVRLADLQSWYDLDLGRCRLKVIPLPFFEEQSRHPQIIDAAEVNTSGPNPFHAVSRESGRSDIFVNNGMLEMVYPLANVSLFVCHFPEREKSRFFYVGPYTEIIHNSLYTARWIEKRWGLRARTHIYPPVDMEPASFPLPKDKEDIILSVSRFDPGGNKQQMEMIKMFQDLRHRRPRELAGWRFVLVGGSPPDNPYLRGIEAHLRQTSGAGVELKINIPAGELKSIYARSKIFWHFCGLGQTDPAKVEHFGMTVAEAMQNGCVPVVFRGGGQTETVEDGASGFLFSSERELIDDTLELVGNPARLEEMSRRAYQRGKKFSREVFSSAVRDCFRRLLAARFFETDSG